VALGTLFGTTNTFPLRGRNRGDHLHRAVSPDGIVGRVEAVEGDIVAPLWTSPSGVHIIFTGSLTAFDSTTASWGLSLIAVAAPAELATHHHVVIRDPIRRDAECVRDLRYLCLAREGAPAIQCAMQAAQFGTAANLVPVSFSSSRITHNSGMAGGASECAVPLTKRAPWLPPVVLGSRWRSGTLSAARIGVLFSSAPQQSAAMSKQFSSLSPRGGAANGV
jgi:hypothetical protein